MPGFSRDITDNVRRAIWYKLWGNATINPMSALTRATADKIHRRSDCRAWMLEGNGRARARSARRSAARSARAARTGWRSPLRLGAFKTSMLQDVEAGRPIELEALLGAPREIARAQGIPTPRSTGFTA